MKTREVFMGIHKLNYNEMKEAFNHLSEEDQMRFLHDIEESVSKRRRQQEKDPVWSLGQNPVDTGITDGSVNHDNYTYGD